MKDRGSDDETPVGEENPAISTKIKSVIQHWFEEDKVDTQQNEDDFENQRIEFWS